MPEGVIAQPSAPQLWSSQPVISVRRRARPSGGTATRIRTGKRLSAIVINSRGLPGMRRSVFVPMKMAQPLNYVDVLFWSDIRSSRVGCGAFWHAIYLDEVRRRLLPGATGGGIG